MCFSPINPAQILRQLHEIHVRPLAREDNVMQDNAMNA
jgi:hypothetical protein